MTLTWNGENEIGKGSSDQNFGLKPFGIDVIKEMERMGTSGQYFRSFAYCNPRYMDALKLVRNDILEIDKKL